MACKIISYDLDKPNRSYDALFKAIESLGPAWHCLESVWIVDTTSTTAQIRDLLKQHLDKGDTLGVFRLTDGWSTKGMSDECNNWLHEHIKAA